MKTEMKSEMLKAEIEAEIYAPETDKGMASKVKINIAIIVVIAVLVGLFATNQSTTVKLTPAEQQNSLNAG